MNETKILSDSDEDLLYASELIKNGEVVGLPTETVYGLGADAINPMAVKRIFAAKGRPSDNPLIVHISKIEQLEKIAYNIPDLAYTLAKEFWPGPLTIILPKKDIIPVETSGGLDTVGIRMPAHKLTLKIIELSGCPIAAPSANRSGYPSPTTAQHVFYDMKGRIPAIVDGGDSCFGVESTVVAFEKENAIRILRPGFVTKEDLLKITDKVVIDDAILNDINPDQPVLSPGMKYKHYSPKAKVILIDSNLKDFIDYFQKNFTTNTYALVFDGDVKCINSPRNCISYGNNSIEQAHQIFAKLRELDNIKAEKVFIRTPSKEGVGLAVYNRLLRAAGFEVVKI